METPRITWKQGPYSGQRGSLTSAASTIEIASIGWTSKRNDPSPWKLRMDLPGFGSEREFTDLDLAKLCAERILQRFSTIVNQSVAPPEENADHGGTQVKLNIEIFGVPPEHLQSLQGAMRNAVDWLTEKLVCGSQSPERRVKCELEARHDGPTCHNGELSWPCPHSYEPPSPKVRSFTLGREVVRRSDLQVFRIVDRIEDTLLMFGEDGRRESGVANGNFWASYYAKPRKAVAPIMRMET